MLRVNNLCVRFGGDPVFDSIGFQVSHGERIGLTGRNGAGKSTLLKVISGINNPDSGSIETPTGYTIGYLAQDLDSFSELSIIEEAKRAFEHLEQLENEIAAIQKALIKREDYHSEEYHTLIDQLNEKEQQLHLSDAQKRDELAGKVLTGLGFEPDELDNPVKELSGGWQMRIELAKILLQEPDLILLDEPTNHLDIESILWLEEYLCEYNGSVILVSHDKAFLDNVTNRTIEIVLGKIEDYKCNYSNYLVQRQDRIEKQVQAKKNQDDYIKQTKRNIERFRAKKNKAKFAQTLIKKLDKLEKVQVDDTDNTAMRFHFPPATRSGKVVVKVSNAAKSYGAKKVLNNVNLEIERGEKVAFVGKNGMGKTTLSKMIVGEEDYIGSIELGHNVDMSYFAQHQAEILNGDLTVFETIDDLATGENRTKVRSILGSFLFSGEDVDKKVKVLSGGERTRLALIKLTLEPMNLLVLDEPTNHLDMKAKDMLKEAITNYDGTVIVVSHDRDFLQGMTTKVFEFKEHKVQEHLGDINDFLSKRKAASFREFELNKKQKEEKSRDSDKHKQSNKQVYKLKKELRSLENKISGLESRIAEKDTLLKDYESFKKVENDPSFFSEYEQMKAELEQFMEEWEVLAEKIGE